MKNIQLALGITDLFDLLLTCGNYCSAVWAKQTSKNLFENTCSSVVLVSTCCRLGILTSVSKNEFAASRASEDDK